MNAYVGVDGCKGGWFAVEVSDDGTWRFSTHETVADVWRSFSGARLILIDIPIGLVDSGTEGRRCDGEARKLLGSPRASSVFTPPARPALYETSREAASARNQEITGRKLSIQAWAIAPKIWEVDQFLRGNPDARDNVREIHPEVLFWALNGRKAMSQRKKRKPGYAERLAVLRSVFAQAGVVANEALARFRRREVARDDILDALAAAVTGLLSGGNPISVPIEPERDSFDLPMEMVYWEANPGHGNAAMTAGFRTGLPQKCESGKPSKPLFVSNGDRGNC